jgi:O-acetyl-ADP-ribose deacetylase (regulator of RNase III)
MIELKRGDILKADAEALVNTVNCVGIMGRGIAIQFRKAFPENFKAYKALCDNNGLSPGGIFVYDLERLENPHYIFNLATKKHWRAPSRIEYIKSGLKALTAELKQRNVRSVAVPPLGCGLGGLNWGEVRVLIEQALSTLPEVKVLLYEPAGAPVADTMAKEKSPPHMTVGRAALLGLMQRYLAGLMDPFITLLEIHKLMYFMQVGGEKL